MNELLWYTSRATGLVSVVLLTAVVVLGVLISGRRRPHGDSPLVVMGLHRWLSLGLLSFLALHVTTAVAETYVSIDLVSALVPFTSGYERVWVGLGTLAVDLLGAVLITSWLRHRMPERRWRLVHWLTYAMWPIAVLHGFMLGTADEPWLRFTTLGCGVVGILATAWRVGSTFADRERRADVAAQEWS